jgi:tight adherence protein B
MLGSLLGSLGAKAWWWIVLLSGISALASLVVFLVGSRRSVLFVQWGRYVDYLTRRLRQLHIFTPASRLAHAQVAALFAVGTLGAAQVLPAAWLFAIVIALGPAFVLERRVKKRVLQLDMQAAGFALALANSLKSTASVGAALDTAAHLVDGPIAEEFQLAVKETRLGISLDEALAAVGPRAVSDKVATVLAALLIGRQVGGNLPRVLETTAATLREMERLEGVVRQKTADSRMQIWGLSIAPFIICGAMYKLDSSFFTPLTQSTVGYIVVISAVLMYLVGLVTARKVLRVDI